MTKEQFYNQIQITTLKDDKGNTLLSGRIVLKSVATMSDECASDDIAMYHAKNLLKEELWRLVYEDRRKLFMQKITEARRCAFWDFKTFDEKMREISTLVLEGL